MNFNPKTSHFKAPVGAGELCQQYQIKPLRRRGQNFLTNVKICDKIIEAAELKSNDLVLEIGAGLGALTKELALRVKKVIAVEIDRKLAEILKDQLANYKNVEIVRGDILEARVVGYIGAWVLRNLAKTILINQLPNCLTTYKLVANLPYNITGAVLRKFLAEQPKPSLVVLMLQKEVAQRIIAKPPKMSLLSVMVQFYGQPKIISYVSKNNFWPRPKVDSAIVRISKIGVNDTRIDADLFFKILRTGFSSPRKFLLNNLIREKFFDKILGQKIFRQADLDFKVRAGELMVDEWIKLYKLIEAKD